MKQTNRILLVAVCFCYSLVIMAQTAKKDTTLNRTVVVEKEYNPDIMDASKINILPKVNDPSIIKKTIEYNTTLSPFSSLNYPMQPSLLHTIQLKEEPGFARLGYGNNGNIDAKFTYYFDLSKLDKLGVIASLGGMNGSLDVPNYENTVWNSRFYRSTIDATYKHSFDKYTFDAAINIGVDNFNYRPLGESKLTPNDNTQNSNIVTDKQRHNKWMLHAGLRSTSEDIPLQFIAETDFLSFTRAYQSTNSETIWRLKAEVFGKIDDNQTVGIDANINSFIYSDKSFSNYTSLAMNSYYRYIGDNWNLKLGAHIDLSFGKGRFVEIAPDIEADYLLTEGCLFYAKLGGGRELNDFRKIEQLSPYNNFTPVNNTFNQLDARLGLKSNLGGGFWLDVFTGYKAVTNDLCTTDISGVSTYMTINNLVVANTRHSYIGSILKYEYKDLVDLSLREAFYAWNNPNDIILILKPKFDIQLDGSFKILSHLTANIGYQFTTRNNVVTLTESKTLSPVNNLSLGATYRLNNEISFYGKINNLLNKSYQYSYNYPEQGTSVLFGASIRF